MGGSTQSISYTKLPPCPSMKSRATARQARQAPLLRVSHGNLGSATRCRQNYENYKFVASFSTSSRMFPSLSVPLFFALRRRNRP